MSDIPKSIGAYWWRANDECDWDPVYVREDSTVPGYEYTVLFPETGVEIDLPDLTDLRGQWAKAHNPDEGIEAWVVFGSSGKPQAIDRDPDMCRSKVCHWDQESWNILMKHGYTCRKVRVCEVNS